MKIISVFFVLAIWLTPVTASAAPFLVCDQYPVDSQPTHYKMVIDGSAVQTPYGGVASDGGSVVLDLGSYGDGAHQITGIQACNARGCSEPPLDYAVPGRPGQPSLRLVP